MRNMHIKGCRNFVYPTEKGSEWHRKSEAAFKEIHKPKANILTVTNRHHDTSCLSERMKRRLGVAV